MVEQADKNRRAGWKPRYFLCGDEVKHGVSAVARHDHQPAAAIGGKVQAHRHGKDVKQRHHAQDALIGGTCRQRRFALADVDRHLPVADVDALRPTGRAAGVLQGRKLAGSGPWLR
jgi:hypothetical protein